MSLQTKNKILRLLTIAVFILGALLICIFASFSKNVTAKEDVTYENIEAAVEADKALLNNGVISIEISYYLYFAAVCVTFILSIMFAKITGIITTILRTVFLGIAAVCSYGGMAVIKVLSALRKIFGTIDLGHPDAVYGVSGAAGEVIGHADIEAATVGVLSVILSVVIFFILAVTATVSLLKKPRKEQNSVQR